MKITLLTSTHNNIDNIHDLYQSVLRNREYLHEWIICDDGSTDGTWEAVKEFPHWVYGIQQKKHGYWYSRNLNNGLRLATGDMVFVVNGDSLLEDDTLKILSDTYEAGTVGSALRVLFHEGKFVSYEWRYPYGNNEKIDVTERPLYWCFMTGNGLFAPTHILKEVQWDEGYRDYGNEDWDIVVRLKEKGMRLLNYNNVRILTDISIERKGSETTSKRFNDLVIKLYGENKLQEWYKTPGLTIIT